MKKYFVAYDDAAMMCLDTDDMGYSMYEIPENLVNALRETLAAYRKAEDAIEEHIKRTTGESLRIW